MKKIIKYVIDLSIAFILIKIAPLDSYSYSIGLLTMLIWELSDLIYKKYSKDSDN